MRPLVAGPTDLMSQGVNDEPMAIILGTPIPLSIWG